MIYTKISMPKLFCTSIKLQALIRITDKCYKAIAFDGSEALFPVSQVVCEDLENENAWWVTDWILQQKTIQHSKKRQAWIDTDTLDIRVYYPTIVEHHVPTPITDKPIHDNSLER
jgi:hypothetical protein